MRSILSIGQEDTGYDLLDAPELQICGRARHGAAVGDMIQSQL